LLLAIAFWFSTVCHLAVTAVESTFISQSLQTYKLSTQKTITLKFKFKISNLCFFLCIYSDHTWRLRSVYLHVFNLNSQLSNCHLMSFSFIPYIHIILFSVFGVKFIFWLSTEI